MAEEDSREIKVGEWYLCAECPDCHQAIPILHILPDAPISGEGTFAFEGVACPHCGRKHDHPLKSLQRLQAIEGEPTPKNKLQ